LSSDQAGRERPAFLSPFAAEQRALGIRWILDTRFSLSAMERWKRDDAAWWASRANNRGRGTYEEAMRQLRRLEAATASEIDAEMAAMRESRL
jgi:hypothetical protein